jgi:hypothetical protein
MGEVYRAPRNKVVCFSGMSLPANHPNVVRRLFEPQNVIRVVGHQHDDLPTTVSLAQQVRNAYPLQLLSVGLISDGNAAR